MAVSAFEGERAKRADAPGQAIEVVEVVVAIYRDGQMRLRRGGIAKEHDVQRQFVVGFGAKVLVVERTADVQRLLVAFLCLIASPSTHSSKPLWDRT